MKKIPYNSLNTEKQKLKFKKQVIAAVSDYLKFILSDFEHTHKKLKRKIVISVSIKLY